MWAIFRFVRRLLKTVVLLVFSVTVVPISMLAIALAIVLFTPVPVTIPAKKAQPQIQPSKVYDANGDLIYVFRKVDTNIATTGADIPQVLKEAVISAEDRRFYTHNGVDAVGLVRALRRDIKTGEAEQGASTITQQLVNNVYYPEDPPVEPGKIVTPLKRNADKVWRKLRVAVIANRLDRTLDKETIVEEYLSNIFFGNGSYGVGAASRVYFRKPVSELTISEAATIAGIIPAPSKYEPRGNRGNAEFKRKVTLAQMRRERYITFDQYQEAVAQELWVDPGDGTLPPPGRPVTVVFGPTEVETAYPYFVDYVRRYLLAKYGEEMVYGGGLEVRTTLDPRMQLAAEETAAAALKGTAQTLEMSIVSVEPQTGFVKVIVGGRNFATDQVNLGLGYCPPKEVIDRIMKGASPKVSPTCDSRIDGGGTGRSPGSSLKPIVLAAAFEQNYPPSLVVAGSPYRDPRCGKKGKCTTIRNYEGAAYGPVDLRTATVKSVNTAYARLGYEVVGLDNVAKMAQRLGITSAWYDPKKHGPSYSLGGIDVAPLEMASAYAVFAGRGKGAPSTPVLTVTDGTGAVLEDNVTRVPTQIISERVADNVTSVLRGVVESGTGKRAALGDRAVAGKTGTSQGYGNAWFVGYTPTLSTAVWMGYKDRPRKMVLRGVGQVAGGTVPAKTWGRYMKVALANVPVSDFDEPAPIVRPKLSLKEEKKLRARQGINPGVKRRLENTPVPRYIESVEQPPAIEPSATPDSVASTVPSTIAEAVGPPINVTAPTVAVTPAPA